MIPAGIKSNALQLARRKLDGKSLQETTQYLNTAALTVEDVGLLINRLKALPDLDSYRPATHDEETRQKVIADYKNNVPQTELAVTYGVPRSTIGRWCRTADESAHAFGKEEEVASTLKRQSEELVARVKAVGWTTVRNGDGVKVWTPEGSLTIHLTPSDIRSVKNTTAELERRGLKTAEIELAAELEEQRRQRIRDDAERSARRTEQTMKRAEARAATARAALVRASGPYLGEPEDVELAWFTESHPAPWMRWVTLTPEICQFLLEFHNVPGKPGVPGTNRPQSEARIAYYRDSYVSGQWHLTHQGYAMDRHEPSPRVQDGQHRMAAIVAAGQLLQRLKEMPEFERDELLAGGRDEDGVQVQFRGLVDADGKLIDQLRVPAAFFVGMAEENFAAIDDVMLRNAAQLFTQAGEKNGATLQMAAGLIHYYRDGGKARRSKKKRTSTLELMALANKCGDPLRHAAAVANSHARKAWIGVGPFAAAMYLIGEENGHNNKFVRAYFEGILTDMKVGTRTKLYNDDPRAAVRNTMWKKKEKKERTPTPDQLGILLTGWNLLVAGRNMQSIRWTQGAELPDILNCPDTLSKPPRALTGDALDELQDDQQ